MLLVFGTYHFTITYQGGRDDKEGFDGPPNFIDQVDVIDTISKTISSAPTNKLIYAKSWVSAIVVENVIYVLGVSFDR